VVGILVLLILYTCYLTQEVLVPVMMAILLALVLSPLVNALERAHLPRALGGFIVLLALTCGFVGAVYGLAQPARDWITSVPTTVHTLQQRFRFLQGPLRQAQEAGQKIEAMTQAPGAKTVVSPARPGMIATVLSSVPHVLGMIAVILILTFFLLSSGDNFLRRLVEVAPGFSEKKVVVGIARDIQIEISRYLLTIGVINLALGCATAAVVAWLGLSNPLLWGAAAALFNFAPYVGPGITTVALALAGLSTFNTLGHALAVPGAFLLLAFCEGQLITPMVIGRRLTLNPAVVFVWLLLWGWLWGLVGILLAGPLLASFRIVCLYVPALRGVSVVISDVRVDVDAGPSQQPG
jgi:predicted PurR-regulated permease PerM